MGNDLESGSDFEVVRALTEELVEQCKSIRVTVFVNEQKFPLDAEVDSYDSDPSTIHLLLRVSSTLDPIGTLRLYPSPSTSPALNTRSYKLGRVCILEPYRKFKLGAKLITTAHAILKEALSMESSEQPVEADIVLHSQIPAMGFYARCGYEPYGDEFDEDGAPHRAMRIVLTR